MHSSLRTRRSLFWSIVDGYKLVRTGHEKTNTLRRPGDSAEDDYARYLFANPDTALYPCTHHEQTLIVCVLEQFGACCLVTVQCQWPNACRGGSTMVLYVSSDESPADRIRAGSQNRIKLQIMRPASRYSLSWSHPPHLTYQRS